MLESIKRLFGNDAPPRRSWPDQSAWAQANGWRLRGVREADGFVIDGRSGTQPWRLEWGPSQRHYIAGAELRLRAELDLPRELQVLVLDRALMESMERAVFEQYVEGVQTRIDTGTPAEMRWLVMYPKLAGSELKVLRDGWGAVGSYKPWLVQWLDGALGRALAALPAGGGEPRVLLIARGRLSLRTALAEPAIEPLRRWVGLFECALQEARRVAVDNADLAAPSTQPSLFPPSLAAGAEASRR
jgi:hypothetical protein